MQDHTFRHLDAMMPAQHAVRKVSESMENTTPKYIVCAVRARPRSIETVTRAIDLALESNARLTFVYIVDAEFQAHATIGPLSVVYHELVEMSQFVMLILCDRARRRGVEQVGYVVREGNVRKQLTKSIGELQPDVLVMGSPASGPGRPAFKPAEFDALVAELERTAHLRVVLAPPSADSTA
jgi:nucleotide-binding universal stress UspA family protein